MYGTPIYRVWNMMIQRCHNPKNKSFDYYGGRGIFVDQSWHTFQTFYDAVGDRPKGLSLDRIDNNDSYKPGNVRWATMKEQHENMRSVPFYEHNGTRLTLTQWAESLGVSKELIRGRIRRGSSFSDAISMISCPCS
jgi:hypothetical protein